MIDRDIKLGVIKPLKMTIFNANQIEEAFRFLASGKHIGKVLIKIKENEFDDFSFPISVLPRIFCFPEFSYVIPGGLGGMGLELADFLVLRGCKKLILNSRRGLSNSYQSFRIS